MRKIYVCSPLRGNIKQNIKKAKEYSRQVVLKGKMPITPHIYFTQFLDDLSESERKIGMKMGRELLKVCDEVWVYGTPSEGMRAEIKLAIKLGIKVKYVEK